VLTPDTDTYYGAHMIIEEIPSDPAVSALLFTTQDWNDTREQARNKIESYVVRGPKAPWFLYETQLQGQQTILLFASVNAVLPIVGDVVYLVQDEGLPTEYSQYCRVASVESEIQTFTAGAPCNTFQRKIVTVGIDNPLRHTFDGAAITCLDDITPDAIVRTTQVADASRYFGTLKLTQAAAAGDINIQAESAYSPLVPSTRGETPVVDVQPGGDKGFTITSGPETFTIIGPAHTGGIDITLGNQALNYTYSCTPVPAPGALTVEYRSLGRWYTLQDDGSGALTGDGSGVIDYNTGSVIITLLALPDVDSAILLSWNSGAHYTDRAGSVDYDPITVQHTLATAAEPGSVSISWLQSGNTKTATVAVDGGIDGDATGHVNHATGEVFLICPPSGRSSPD